MDLAEGHLAALDFIASHAGWVAINLGTGQGVSVLEMVNEYERASGKSIPYSIEKRRSGDIASCFAKVDKAKNMLHWQAKRNIKDMCSSEGLWQKYRKTLP
jgi:UDP-glucose 4-epimerase